MIDQRLLNDSDIIFQDTHITVLLKKDSVPWVILVPNRNGIVEFFELTAPEQTLLMQYSNNLAAYMRTNLGCKKVNVANLGNIVSQFHWHVIARFENDRAWPGPIWGTGDVSFNTQNHEELKKHLTHLFLK